MRTALRIALTGSLVLLVLGGCRTAPPPVFGPGADAPWAEQEAALRRLDRYSLTGRVAVAAGEQGFSGSLRYQQQPEQADLAIDGPLGMGGLRLAVDNDDIRITTGRGEKFNGNAALEELERRLGFELPIKHLRWWLLGIPAPGVEGPGLAVAADGQGYNRIEQDGWKVNVQSRAPAMGFALPQRLVIERPGARLKLVIDKWLP